MSQLEHDHSRWPFPRGRTIRLAVIGAAGALISCIALLFAQPAAASHGGVVNCFFPTNGGSCPYTQSLSGSSGWQNWRWADEFKVSTFTNASFQVWRNRSEGVQKYGTYSQSAGGTGYYVCCTRYYMQPLLYNVVYASATYTSATVSNP